MSVADLVQSLNNTRLNSVATPPKFKQQGGIKRLGLGVSNSPVGTVQPIGQTPSQTFNSPGSTVQSVLQNSKNNAQSIYDNYRTNSNTDLAQNILKQSAGTVPTDRYGIISPPQSQTPNLDQTNLGTINQTGKTALQGAQDKALWQKLNQMQNLNISSFGTYDPANIPSGATPSNPGAQAIAVAMTAYKNHVPYVWGGNSLSKGVDCASLVQLAYAKIGIKLPRTSYEQAKSGQIIKGVQNALPGDLIFYNTGSRDPNGIGVNSHVAIYLGNGMILEAANSKAGIRKASVNYDGTPSTIVRPWS
jgi:cell wall-associated NlpC family hydrolase